MTSSERMMIAMELGVPDRIPVQCQLSIGHILLNTGTTHYDFNFSSEAYARALLRIRELYDFDGILLHKPGRDPGLLNRICDIKRAKPYDEVPDWIGDGVYEDVTIRWEDGATTELPFNDDPKYRGPKGYKLPDINQVDFEHPFEGIPESLRDFWIYKALFDWDTPESFPDYYFDAMDLCLKETAGKCHIHGEIKAPTDAVLNLLGLEQGLLAFFSDGERVHRLLEYFTKRLSAWAVAQARRGCHAIKISSPYAGGGFISPQMYEEFVVPYEREIARAVKKEGAYIYTHTCGAIGDRLESMVDSEISGIECLDPPPLGNIEIEEAKDLLKDRIFIKGNIDSVNVLLRGTPEEVIAETRRCLEVGAKGGGYILSTACSVAPAVHPGQILRMVEECGKFDPAGVN